MCLLVVVSRLDPEAPLVIGANRDERLVRPATAMTVLAASQPRILGGRDEEAGGTWLAINEHGVVAGLTNRPSPEGRDPTKRSRGELPLALASHRDAASAVDEFITRFRPAEFNPAWLLVGDPTSLYSLDMSGSGTDQPAVEALDPGIHILENNPLHAASPKSDHVRALLGDAGALGGETLIERVRGVLADHSVPDTGPSETASIGGPQSDGGADTGQVRPPETLAACVHTDAYGTRSSTLVSVPAGVGPGSSPRVFVADGHPCTEPFVDVTDLFRS
jgi:uncharacterized protein with NRDE domain